MTGFDRAQQVYDHAIPPYLEAEELDDDPDVLGRCDGCGLLCDEEEAAVAPTPDPQRWPSHDEMAAWLTRTFGTSRDVLAQGLKMAEETGELCGAIVKRADNRPPPPEGWDAHVRDEIADVALAALAVATTEGFDLAAAVAEKWVRVQRKYAETGRANV